MSEEWGELDPDGAIVGVLLRSTTSPTRPLFFYPTARARPCLAERTQLCHRCDIGRSAKWRP